MLNTNEQGTPVLVSHQDIWRKTYTVVALPTDSDRDDFIRWQQQMKQHMNDQQFTEDMNPDYFTPVQIMSVMNAYMTVSAKDGIWLDGDILALVFAWASQRTVLIHDLRADQLVGTPWPSPSDALLHNIKPNIDQAIRIAATGRHYTAVRALPVDNPAQSSSAHDRQLKRHQRKNSRSSLPSQGKRKADSDSSSSKEALKNQKADTQTYRYIDTPKLDQLTLVSINIGRNLGRTKSSTKKDITEYLYEMGRPHVVILCETKFTYPKKKKTEVLRYDKLETSAYQGYHALEHGCSYEDLLAGAGGTGEPRGRPPGADPLPRGPGALRGAGVPRSDPAVRARRGSRAER
jgi:hypothetical protein